MKPHRLAFVRSALAGTLLSSVLAAGGARWAARGASTPQPAQPRTVILVRHAEKASDDPKDPSLSELGQERARALARLLARSGARRLVASEFKRTRETLAPLGQALGVEVESVPARELERLSKELAASPPGSTVVVAGHSNTVPALAARLGAPLAGLTEGPPGAALDDAEYDRLFVLTLPPEGVALAPAVLELAYGRESP